jgi:hypothetical protein
MILKLRDAGRPRGKSCNGRPFPLDQRAARVQVDPVMRSLARLYGNADGGIGKLEPALIE